MTFEYVTLDLEAYLFHGFEHGIEIVQVSNS